jgi:hypothetical protein
LADAGRQPISAPRRSHKKLQHEQTMATREDELKELSSSLSTAIAKARQLNLPTSAYILSMALVEVSRALSELVDSEGEGEESRR